ncbi:MAG TPA: HAD hydrolase-like protein [archaeon]|nr:HAD hydrolase-like protein [archaeon]
MTIRRVILFDIDGTILSTSATEESERRRYVDTIRDVVGVEPSVAPWRFAGMVDPQICKILLTELGLSDNEVKTFLPKVLARMGEVYRDMEKTVTLNRGVRELLVILASSTDYVTGILTGNLTAVAEEKLSVTAVRAYFSELFCANGYFDRRSLVEDAVRTCVAKHELNGRGDVVIVGDTPRDVEAANTSKATSVGVASGSYTTSQLSEAGAKYVYPNLEPTNELLEGLGVKR